MIKRLISNLMVCAKMAVSISSLGVGCRGRLLMQVLAIMLATATIANGMGGENPGTTDWYSWELPQDHQIIGTALDVSYLLDAPAGKYGYVKAQGENLVFENTGKRVRFWGTNMVMQANFLDNSKADQLVDRIAAAGFNMVRFHHMDYGTSNNIFSKDTMTTTKSLDAGQLDNMFYFISELKKRGIYIYMDLLVSRQKTTSDNITDASDLNQGWKAHAVFSDELIALQKQYAEQLLTAVNPYTGIALKDDPALVFMDIHNENSLFVINAGEISSSYYLNELNAKFSAYLAEKYATDAELSSAWAQSGKIGLEAEESMENGTVQPIGDGTSRYPDLLSAFSNQRADDTRRFIYDTVGRAYVIMRDFLKDEIGVKCLVTGSSMGGSSSAVAGSMSLNKEHLDFTDRHNYMSHPTNSLVYGSSFDNQPLVTSGNNFFRNIAYRKTYGQPFVVGEWQQCQGNDYRAEGDLMMAAFSNYQNWNSIQFQMLHEQPYQQNSKLTSAFATYNDPIHTSTQAAAAILFHNQDVDEAQQTYYYKYSENDTLTSKGFTSENLYKRGKTGTIFEKFEDFATDGTTANDESVRNSLLAKESSKVHQLNDQMTWDTDEKYFAINAQYTNAVMGLIPNVTTSLEMMDVTFSNSFAAVSLSSITQAPLNNTGRMLLTVAGKARNKDFELSGDGGSTATINSTGSAPVIVEPIEAEIVIKTNDPISVYALTSSGERKPVEITVTETAQGYQKFNVDGINQSLHYEVVREIINITLNPLVDNEAGRVRVQGVVQKGGMPYVGKVVNLKIIKPAYLEKNSAEIMQNPMAAIAAVNSTVTDQDGAFTFNARLDKRGRHKVEVAVEQSFEWYEIKQALFEYEKEMEVKFFKEGTPIKSASLGDTITARFDGVPEQRIIFLAVYRDNKLIDVKMNRSAMQQEQSGAHVDEEELSIEYTIPSAGVTLKAMVWNSMESIAPVVLVDSITVE